MTWRSREPRGPRKMAERLTDRRSSRDQGGRVRVCYSTYFPSQIVQMGIPAVHTPHMCIWKMLPCTGLLEGFWDMVLGANSTSSFQFPPNLSQFTFILFILKWSWRLDLGPPSITFSTQAFYH